MADDDRKRFLGLSLFQLIAGALAAMTSAWIASALGVAGTIIGAAVGSFVVSITSAFYANTLDRGRTLVVQTDSGRIVETTAEPGETSVALEEVREATHEQIRGAEVIDPPRRFSWKAVLMSGVAILVVAVVAMGAYELVTDKSYGSNPDNSRIGNPWGGGSSESDEDPEPSESTPPSTTATTPTPTTTTPTPSEPTPTATITTEPPPAE